MKSPADFRRPVVVLACFLGNSVGAVPMISATFGVFLVPVTHALGWPRAAFSMVLLCVSIAGFVVAPIAGRLVDRYGVRRVVTVGNLCFGLAMASLSLIAPSHIVIYALYTLAGAAAFCCGPVVLSKSIALWFTRNHGLLFGLTNACGVNVGAAITPILAVWLIRQFGWHGAFLALGAIVIVVGQLAATLQFAPPAQAIPAGPQHGDPANVAALARKQPVFWLLLAAIVIGGGSLNGTMTHIIPILTDRAVSIGTATTAFAVCAIVSGLWQIVLGILVDRTNSPKIAGILMGLSIAGFFLLGHATGTAMIMIGAGLLGMAIGTEWALLPICVLQYFGPRAFSSLYGRIMGTSVLVSGSSPILMDFVFDRSGSYALPLVGAGLAVATSAILIISLPRFARHEPGAADFAFEPGIALADAG